MPRTKVPYLDTRGKRQVARVKKYVRRKTRGHTHELYDIPNTRGIMITRCKVCKHHFFYIMSLKNKKSVDTNRTKSLSEFLTVFHLWSLLNQYYLATYLPVLSIWKVYLCPEWNVLHAGLHI